MKIWHDEHRQATLMARKRASILDAAQRQFLVNGFGSTSMDAVAEDAGVSVKTIYRHFDNKEELFVAAARMVCEARADRFDEISTWPPERCLPAYAQALIDTLLDQRELALFRVVIAEGENFPELLKMFERCVIQYRREILARYLDERSKIGDVHVKDPMAAATLFTAMLSGAVMEGALVSSNKLSLEEGKMFATRAADAFVILLRSGAAG